MKFTELKEIMDEVFGTSLLADIAKEFEVTPQVVSNWKARDQVPYKYVKLIREKIKEKNNYSSYQTDFSKSNYDVSQNIENEDVDILKTIFDYLTILKKYKEFIIVITAICFFLQIISLKYYTTPVYVSKATILPSGKGSANSNKFQSFAKQFGLGTSDQNGIDLSSSVMFPDILSSKRLARELLGKKFDTIKYGEKRSLISIIKEDETDRKEYSERSKSSAIRKLQKNIRIRPLENSPLIKITVSAFEAKLSVDLVNALIEEFQILLKSFRISRLKEKKLFIMKRLEMVEKELFKSEDVLKIFRQKNREILSSPTLLLELERLSREVEVQTQVFINLKNQFELIQIEEIGESSVMQILDYPEIPLYRASPNVTRSLFLSILFGITLSGLLAIGKEKLPILRLKYKTF